MQHVLTEIHESQTNKHFCILNYQYAKTVQYVLTLNEDVKSDEVREFAGLELCWRPARKRKRWLPVLTEKRQRLQLRFSVKYFFPCL